MESPANPKAFSGAISTISVAQICLSAGYKSSQPSALRALSDVAIQYIQSIGRLSATFANSQNRTDSNLLDLILSLETLYSTRGFSGGSNFTKSILKSSVLKELMPFVSLTDEVPFAKSLSGKQKLYDFSTKKSFMQLEREAPKHVPRWLPCFPDIEKEERESVNEERESVNFGGSVRENKSENGFVLDLREERERIRFRVDGLRKKKRRVV